MNLAGMGKRERAHWLVTVCLSSILAVASSCDQKQVNSPPAVAPPPAPVVDARQRYMETIRPLVEELQRMRILLEHLTTMEKAEFDRQYREVRLRWDQVESKVTAEDRQLASWKHFVQGIEFLRRGDKGLTREAELGAQVEAMREPENKPRNLDQLKEQGTQTVAAMKEVLLLERGVPRDLAAAGAAIGLAEAELKEGH